MTLESESVRASRAHAVGRRLARLRSVTDRVGGKPTLSRIIGDAGKYWAGDSGPRSFADSLLLAAAGRTFGARRRSAWEANSHWRDGIGDEAWLEVGDDHLAIFRMFAKALGISPDPGVTIEWGCGGGANAIAFAPIAKRFIAADVSRQSVDECVRQVNAVCSVPTEPLHIDIEHPERAIAGLEETCDTFLCLYVIELTPSPEEALRILRIAERLLVPGGMALVQIKYHTADFRPPVYKRNYWRNPASMTTFGIDEFWLRAGECGLTPRLLTLVPKNRLDSRYAYYALTKP